MNPDNWSIEEDMGNKIKAAIIGPGNIGTDLLMKAKRSALIEPVWMVGVEPQSPGLARAREMGLKTTADGVDGMLATMRADGVQICFDATSAYVHASQLGQGEFAGRGDDRPDAGGDRAVLRAAREPEAITSASAR